MQTGPEHRGVVVAHLRIAVIGDNYYLCADYNKVAVLIHSGINIFLCEILKIFI